MALVPGCPHNQTTSCVDDSNPSIQWESGWHTEPFTGAVNGTAHMSTEASTVSSMPFLGAYPRLIPPHGGAYSEKTGVSVGVYGLQFFNESSQSHCSFYYVDSRDNLVKNCKQSSNTSVSQLLYGTNSLEPGTHTLFFYNPGVTMWIDFFLLSKGSVSSVGKVVTSSLTSSEAHGSTPITSSTTNFTMTAGSCIRLHLPRSFDSRRVRFSVATSPPNSQTSIGHTTSRKVDPGAFVAVAIGIAVVCIVVAAA